MTNTKDRVLFFSPYARWHYHTTLEVTWAHALRQRGAETKFVLCNEVLPTCDIFRANLNPRRGTSCLECQAGTTNHLSQMNMPFEWLGDYLPREVRSQARKWVQTLPKADLLQAEWEGLPVGEWAATSAYYQYRTSKLDLDDPAVEETVRGLIVGTVHTAKSFEVLLDEYRPDTLVLLNGRFFSHWTAIEMAKKRGVRFVTHERGMRKSTVRFAENYRTHELAPMHELWYRWKDVPLSRSEVDYVASVLQDRSLGRNYSFLVFSPPVDGEDQPSSLRQFLGFDSRPLVAVFNSSDDETAAFDDRREGAFPNSRDFLPAVLQLARKMPEVQFVIRMHPNIQSTLGTNEAQLQHAREIRDDAPENVHVIMPSDNLSSYLLIAEADAGVVYGSTVGLEMACAGKPVLCMAQATYSHVGCTRQLDDPRRFADELERALAEGPRVETARLALRWACRYFQHFAQPFDLVVEEPQSCGKLNYSNTGSLAPGASPTLDRICQGFLGTRSVIPHPSPAERTRSSEEEDRFLQTWVSRAPAGSA